MALTQIDDRGLKTPIDLIDNERIRLGTGNDFQLYHSGSNSFLLGGTGNIRIQQKVGEDGIVAIPDGAIELYHNNVKKLETYSSGVEWHGNLKCEEDNSGVYLGVANDLQLLHDGTDSIIKDNRDSGTLRIHADSIGFNDKDVSETMLLATADGSVDLYYNGTKKLETTTTGAKVTNATTPLVEVQNSTDTSYSGVKLEQSSGSGGYFAINKLGTNSSATGGANAAQIWQSGNAPIVIGVNNTEEARFLSGGGLTFNGDTAAANALDDYEEGTFTPTIGGWSGSGTGTYNSQLGRYTKVGNLVTVWYRVTWTNLTGASGVLCVQSLPFAASNSPDWNNSSSCMIENVDLPNSGTGITGHQFSTSSSSILYYVIQDNASWNALSINTSGTILGTASYPTNA